MHSQSRKALLADHRRVLRNGCGFTCKESFGCFARRKLNCVHRRLSAAPLLRREQRTRNTVQQTSRARQAAVYPADVRRGFQTTRWGQTPKAVHELDDGFSLAAAEKRRASGAV